MNNKTYSYKDKTKNNHNIDEDNKITQLQKSKITSVHTVPTTTNSNVLRTKSLTTTINSQQLDLLSNKTIPNCNSNNYMKTYSKLSLFSRKFNHSKTFSNTDAYTASELNDVILKNDIKIKQSIDHINNYLNNHKRKCNSSSRYVDSSRSLSPHRNSSSRNGYTNSYMSRYITNNSNKTTGVTTVTPSAMLSTKMIIPTTTTTSTTYNTKNVSTTYNTKNSSTKHKNIIGVEKKKKNKKKKSNHSIDKVVLCLDELDLDMEYNKNVGTDKYKQSNNNHHPHHYHKIDTPHKLNSGFRVSNKDHHGRRNEKDTHDRHQHNDINHMLYKHKTSTTQSLNSFDTTKAELSANKIYNHQKNHQIVMNVESDSRPLVTHTTLDVKDIHVVDSRVINIPTLIHKESDNNSFNVMNSVAKQVDGHGHENEIGDYRGDDRNDMKYDQYLDIKQNIRTGDDVYSDMIHGGDYNIVSNQYCHPESQIEDFNGIFNDLVISGDDYLKHFDHQYGTSMNIKDDDINEMKVNSIILKDGRTNSNRDNNHKYDVRHDDEMEAYLDVIELAPVSTLHYHQHQLLSINDTYHAVEKYKKLHRSYRSSDALLQTVSNDLLLLSLIERCNQHSYLLINQEVLKASSRLLVTDDVLTRTGRCGQRLHQLVDAVTITIVKKLVSYNIPS